MLLHSGVDRRSVDILLNLYDVIFVSSIFKTIIVECIDYFLK